MGNADLRRWLFSLHDAKLLSLSVDYERMVLELRLSICVGNPEATTEEEREAYKPCRAIISGLHFCIVDPPEDASLLQELGPPSIESADEGVPPNTQGVPMGETSPAVLAWLYVSPWNSFIRFGGDHIELH